MKKLFIILLMSLAFLSCGDLQQCDYKVAVEYENQTKDTLRFIVISDLQEMRLEEGHLKIGHNLVYKDSIASFQVLESICVVINDSLVLID